MIGIMVHGVWGMADGAVVAEHRPTEGCAMASNILLWDWCSRIPQLFASNFKSRWGPETPPCEPDFWVRGHFTTEPSPTRLKG